MSTTTLTADRPEARFVQAFDLHDGLSLNGSNASLHAVRKDAIASFDALGFPTRKTEAWKYTPITKQLQHEPTLLLDPDAAPVPAADVASLLIPGLDAHVAVLVNGRFQESLSRLGTLDDGVVVTGLADAAERHSTLVNAHFAQYADYREEVFTALNTAFTRDGLFVYVPRNTFLERPIHVLSLVTTDEDALVQPRVLVVAEQSSQVTLVQSTHVRSDAAIFANTVTEVSVGANATVDCYEIQDGPGRLSAVNSLYAYQRADSVFRTSTFTLTGEVVRNNVRILPDAEGCESHLFGLFLARDAMHVDNHTLVDHAMPNCFSNELYKGILDDRATGVFNGRVLVRQDAQQTNAYQSNKSIVLSDTARMYSKPELEIYADDVQCSHGATTGQLDADAVFYLRSRGLTERQARGLLLMAFARDVLENVRLDPLRAYLDEQVSARFDT